MAPDSLVRYKILLDIIRYCSSVLEQATDMFYTVLERGQIVYEDATIKNQLFNKLIINYLIN